jgi:hypothetical protein
MYYDDNFGVWDGMDEPEMRDFYREVQRRSVEKVCVDCGRKVRIMPQYECCDSCADRRERGMQY